MLGTAYCNQCCVKPMPCKSLSAHLQVLAVHAPVFCAVLAASRVLPWLHLVCCVGCIQLFCVGLCFLCLLVWQVWAYAKLLPQGQPLMGPLHALLQAVPDHVVRQLADDSQHHKVTIQCTSDGKGPNHTFVCLFASATMHAFVSACESFTTSHTVQAGQITMSHQQFTQYLLPD